MYSMFLEHPKNIELHIITKFYTYRRIFKKQNLSFHKPTKDLCSLCVTFTQGDENVKQSLHDSYNKHIAEKKRVRELKSDDKKKYLEDKSFFCGVFDFF